jgi:hypothetical protein
MYGLSGFGMEVVEYVTPHSHGDTR